jgi:uncharacterized membrane protein
MKLGYPTPDFQWLPSVEQARDTLLAKVHCYREEQGLSKRTSDRDYALLYAYSQLALPRSYIIVLELTSKCCSVGNCAA